MRVEVLPPDAPVPVEVRAPILVRLAEDVARDGFEVTFADGGVWLLPQREVANMRPEEAGEAIADVFASNPRRFHFLRRVRIVRRAR